MLDKFVTSSHAKTGGPCPECGLAIGMFNRIHKYTVVGSAEGTTAAGNGPGVWVCGFCHERASRSVVDLFECWSCLRMVNPGVQVDGRLLCVECYQRRAVQSGRLP